MNRTQRSAVERDPFGRALRDHHRGTRREPLLQRDGPEWVEHPIEEFYFEPFEGDPWLESRLAGPLLDLGAGAGRHALYFQERFETVAVEVSDHLVEVLTERGVADARRADMFALGEAFEPDRFASALVIGTQVGLAGSRVGLERFLSDLAVVTQPGATVVVDCFDPDASGAAELLGYRPDETPGLGFRVMTFEYEGHESGILLFRLFGPERLEEAATRAGWKLADLRWPSSETDAYYQAVLEKS